MRTRLRIFSAGMALALAVPVRAADLDTTGFTALRALHPELIGTGGTVAQVEAPLPAGSGKYQVNPATVGQSPSIFKYYDSTHPYPGAGATYSSSTGSGHSNGVGLNFYGTTAGAAPGLSLVENFEVNYFINEVVTHTTTIGAATYWTPVEIAAPIVNQSFTVSSSNDAQLQAFYDAYAIEYGTLFVNASLGGNALAGTYNGIRVGTISGGLSGNVEILSPGGPISFCLPYVSGAATVLRQAAELGYFNAISGTDPTDSRLLKAGLLNGATKTSGWSHTATAPLDPTAGAGVLNVEGAFASLAGGQKNRSSTALTALGTIPTAAPFTSPVSGLVGWDLNTLTALTTGDAVAHYFFDLTPQLSLTLTATLTWNSTVDLSSTGNLISNFDLVLVDTISHAVIWSSASTTRNVEHIYFSNLSGSKYDLQVILRGGTSTPALTDTYAVAWSWESTGTTPVPESDFVWLIGAAGLLFIVRKRLAARRTRA